MQLLKYIFIGVFLLFATVQYNDPDVALWVIVYLYPAFLLFRSLKSPFIMNTFIFIAIVYVLWAINVFPEEWEGVLLNQVGMKTINIELGRESLGLASVGLVLGLFGIFGNKK